MIYPQKLNSKKSNLILKIGVLMSVFIAILLIVINKLTTPRIPWAAIANGGIIYAWIVLFYSIRKNINIAGHVLLQTIAIPAFCEILLISLIAITRIPVGVYTPTLVLAVYLASITYTVIRVEKQADKN